MRQYKAFSEMTKTELAVVYNQWQTFMERHVAQRERARKQRERNKEYTRLGRELYAKEHNLSEAEEMDLNEEV